MNAPVETQEVPSSGGATKPSDLRFRSAAAWTTLGTFTYTAGRFGVFAVLAKLGSPEVVGQYGLALAIATPLTSFGLRALRPLVATDQRGEFRFHDYLAVQLLTIPLCVVAVAIVILLSGFGAHVAVLTLLVLATKLVEATGNVFYGRMLRYERMQRVGLSMAVKGLVSPPVVAVVYLLTGSVCWAAASLGAWWLLVLICHDAVFTATLLRGEEGSLFGYRPTWSTLRKVVRRCLPAGITAILKELNTNVPRYFVQALLGTVSMGYFTATTTLTNVGHFLLRGLMEAAGPRLARYYWDHTRAILPFVLYLLALNAAVGIAMLTAAIVVGDVILAIAFRPEYAQHYTTLVLLSVAVLFTLLGSVPRALMIASRHLRLQAIQTAGTTTVLAVSCSLLTPYYLVYGAALAVVAASVFECVCGGLFLTYLIRSRASSHALQLDGSPTSAA